MLKRAQEADLLAINLHDIRDHSTDKHHTADDTPFGGGGGMVMKAEPLLAAIEAVRGGSPVILMTPQGTALHAARGGRTQSSMSDW